MGVPESFFCFCPIKFMSKLTKNIIYNLLGQGILLILSFIAVKFIFKKLGADALGIIYFTAIVNAILIALLELGLCSTTVREVSAHYKDEPGYIKDLIRTGSLFYWCAFVVSAGLIYFLSPVFVDNWINLKTMDRETAINVLRILGIASFVALPQSLYASLFRGLQRMELNNFIDVITTAIQQAGAILILYYEGNILSVVYWFTLCYAIRVIVYIIMSAYLFSWKAIIPGYSKMAVKRIREFTIHMMTISITGMIHMQADKIFVSKLMPIGVVGYYGFAYNIASKGTLIILGVFNAAFPALSELFKKGDREGLMILYRKLHDLLCFGLVPVFGLFIFAFPVVFNYVFDPGISKLLIIPATLLCIGFYMNGTLTIPYAFSIAVGKPEIGAKQNVYGLFIVLPVTAILIYYFGITGAALSWVFYHIFAYFYSIPRICSECLEIPVYTWFVHILKILGLTGLTYGIIWYMTGQIYEYSIPSLITGYIIGTILFVGGSYFMIGTELKKFMVNFLAGARNTFRKSE